MRKLLAILLLTYGACGFAQDENPKNVDSLMTVLSHQKESIAKCKTLNALADTFYRLDPEQGIKYADQALKLSSRIGYEEGIAYAKLYKGANLWLTGDNDKALKLYGEAEKLFEKLDDYCAVGLTQLNTGNVYGRNGKFPEGLDAFFKAIRMLEKCNGQKSTIYLANCYQNIGNIYNATESYQKALKNYDTSIALYKKTGDDVSIAMIMGSKGMILNKLERNGEALAIYKDAEKKLIALDQEVPLAYIRSWMGTVYIDLDQYDESIRSSESAFATISKIGDEDLVASTIQNMGHAYLLKAKKSNSPKDLALALENIQKALDMHKAQGNNERMIQDYSYLSDYYSLTKDYKKSLDAQVKFAIYRDSVFNFKNKQSLQNLEDERTIELRDKQIQLNKVTLESKERQKWFYLFGIAALLIIGGLVFLQSQNRKKTNEKLQLLNAELDTANKTKARFFSILNHDLRSPVANLISFLHLQKDSPELLDDQSKKRMETKTISSAENLLESMEDILLWSKGQMENFTPQPKKIAVSALFNDIQKHFSNIENVKILFENPGNESLLTDENYVKTILRNIVGNAIKALHNTPNATVILTATNNTISVSDNGPGGTSDQFRALYDEKEIVGIKTGLGLHLIRDLAKAINCKIAVDSNLGSGTIFTILFQ
ncbi:MAG TPA: tetratricopeptide repeat-containing sensor histidine kinase [Flavobacterium sp.]|nr:tetratricopeptide repeat-containing sensor histidine kinase [Flavobacterium sp.]